MPLSAGTRLGPHEIVAPIGAGGMGEVYRAKDTRLDRTVAIKILPEHLSSDPRWHERFEREARAISALNHPHICTLYDIGHQDGIDYLVMEYVQGETLGDQLGKGPLSPDQVLRYAIQIADALAAAHRRGVIHRDLKPGNIMLTKSGAKLIDFGLAKVAETGAVASVTVVATQTTPLAGEGSILGTFQYMAPEQLEGKEADPRTDLFAFGAVLYEMATGRKAFEGKSHASLIVAILERDPPPLLTFQPLAPPALDHVVRTCLAKEPEARWETAHDVLIQLKWIAEAGSQAGILRPVISRSKSRDLMAWTLVTVLSFFALALLVALYREKPTELQPVRFEVPLPDKVSLGEFGFPVMSPNGRYLVFSGAESTGRSHLWLHSLDSLTTQALVAADNAYNPFWSPDSRFVGFFSGGKLKKIDISGGVAETICDVGGDFAPGGTWNRDGIILFARHVGGLYSVPAAGGDSKRVLELDKSRRETAHLWPYFLPDGRHLLYFSRSTEAAKSGIYVASLDSKETQRLFFAESNVSYAPPGFLIYGRQERLMAQAFDARKLQITGDAFPVTEHVRRFSGSRLAVSHFSVSENGVLAYRGALSSNAQLAWYSRDGNLLGRVGEPADYSNPMISPDQKKVAVSIRDPQTRTRDIWVIALQAGASSRLTFDPGDDVNPTWSPDGARIAFSSDRNGRYDIYVKAATGAGEEQVLLRSSEDKFIEDWSPDGQYFAFGGDPGESLFSVRDKKRVPLPFLDKNFNAQLRFSPARRSTPRWFAYTSSESGQVEVRSFADAFSGSEGKWQISTNGGSEPVWRTDGKELFYASGNKLMALEVNSAGESFEGGVPKKLFEAPLASEGRSNYAVSPDGKRFLMNVLLEDKNSREMKVMLNWSAGLHK